jgi:hypothetical protein
MKIKNLKNVFLYSFSLSTAAVSFFSQAFSVSFRRFALPALVRTATAK